MTSGELALILDHRRVPFVARPGGAGYRAQCPAHGGGDKRRDWSLVVSEGREGRRLLHCFAGCDFPAIARALDLPLAAFFGWSSYRYSGASGPSTSLVGSGSSGNSTRNDNTLTPNLALQRGFRPPELLAAHAHRDLDPWVVRLALPPRAGAAMRSVAEDLQLLFGLCLAAGLDRPAIAYGGEFSERRGTARVRDALNRLVDAGSVVQVRRPRPAQARARFAHGRVLPGRPARAAMYAMGEGAVVAALDKEVQG
jgi:hypothetical protein